MDQELESPFHEAILCLEELGELAIETREKAEELRDYRQFREKLIQNLKADDVSTLLCHLPKEDAGISVLMHAYIHEKVEERVEAKIGQFKTAYLHTRKESE